MDTRRVLVTGASGFIGSRLCRKLGDEGTEVHAVSRGSRGDQYPIHWWTADLADYDATSRVVRAVQPDLVFHLASHVSGSRDLREVLPTVRGNLLSTVNLLTALRDSGRPRTVIAGSAEEPVPTDPDQIPSSPYAAAKVAATTYARTFHARFGLPTLTLRISMVYGPGQQDGAKLIPYVTRSLLRGESPDLSSGNREVDWVYVDDVVNAFIAAANAPEIVGESLDIGTGRLVSVRAVVERIAELIDGPAAPRFGVLADRPFERTLLANLTRSHIAIGWEPRTCLTDGLANTVDWFRQH